MDHLPRSFRTRAPAGPVSQAEAHRRYTRPVDQTRLMVVAATFLAVVTGYAVSGEYFARRQAHARGIASCVAGGRDEGYCSQAAERNDVECFPEFYRPPSRGAQRRFDADGYASCIDVGPDAYHEAKARRAQEGRSRHAESAAAMP